MKFCILGKNKNKTTLLIVAYTFSPNVNFACKNLSEGKAVMSSYFTIVVRKYLKSAAW